MRVITVTQSGSGVTGGRRTQVIVSRTGPQGPAGGGAGSVALDDLTDVSLVGTTSGDFLRYNGTAWTDTKLVAADLADGTSGSSTYLRGDRTWQTHNIDALTDVVITAAASGDFLRNNGTNWVDATITAGDLGTGTASASNYLRGDLTWSSITAADVSAVPTSRLVSTSTGLAGGGDLSADRTLSVLYGTTAGTAAQGNDSRLSDARTPTSHAASHQDGGSDELALHASQVTSGTVATARLGSGTASANTFLRGDQTYQPVPVGNNDMGRVSNAIYLSGTGLSVNGATSGNLAATPDAAAVDITGDIEIVVRLACADWTPAVAQTVVGKRQTAGNYSYGLQVNTSGGLSLNYSTDGTAVVTAFSSLAVGFSDGQAGWVRVTRNQTTGDVIFYTAADSSSEPGSWTQLGTTRSTTPSGIYNSNSQLEFGSWLAGSSGNFVGTIYQVILRDSIGGTPVYNADFTTATADALTFTPATGGTITITTTRYAYGIPNSQMAAQTTLSATINTVYYTPFEVTAPITLDAMAFNLNAAPAAGGNVRMGVYAADSNLQPTGAPLFDSGDVAITTGTTGVVLKQGTAVTLQPGVYLTAFNTGTAVTLRVPTGGLATITTAMGAAMFVSTMSATQTQGAFPTPGTAWTARGTSATGTANPVVMRWRSG